MTNNMDFIFELCYNKKEQWDNDINPNKKGDLNSNDKSRCS